ncbi:hypothetical protein [Sphingosinithalassobacter portus]|uniref:hypothetical protein n=1 Tax=Stakelama portus TaxID=2676234 RepID=UPI000D6E82B9|nr:hypothetical protein [Sphingosinithalassobacter portus]
MEPGGKRRRGGLRHLGVACQGVLLIFASLLAALPPPEGVFLLVPLVPRADGSMARIATDAGAQILSRGEISGSLYVRGSRGDLLPRAVLAGAMLMGGKYVGCSNTEAGES